MSTYTPLILAYASLATSRSRDQPRARRPTQSSRGELAWVVTTLTFLFLAWCFVAASVAPDGAPWSQYVLRGSWAGGVLGALVALPGCFQRTHRRS